jgi:hypothetical protein
MNKSKGLKKLNTVPNQKNQNKCIIADDLNQYASL